MSVNYKKKSFRLSNSGNRAPVNGTGNDHRMPEIVQKGV